MAGNWSDPKVRSDIAQVCSRCYEGDCKNCKGHGQGQRYERAVASAERYPTCLCAEQGHPEMLSCCDTRFRDWNYHRCGKPVKGTIPSRSSSGKGDYDKPLCGIHIGAWKRSESNDRKRKEERERTARINTAAAEVRKVVDETADMLNHIASEFGIDLKAKGDGGNNPGSQWGNYSHVTLSIDPEAAGAFARLLEEKLLG